MTEKPSYEELERRVQELKTDCTQLENQLLESRSLTEEIMTCMTEGLVLTDARETVTLINPRLSEMLGYRPREITGKCWLDMVPMEQQAIAQDAKARRAHGHIDRYEIVLRRKNGEKIPVLIGAGPRFDKQSGQYLGSVAVVNDITERKHTEEVRKASEAAVRNKLKAITEPESDLGELELSDIIDVTAVQFLMEKFHRITGMLSAIVDSNGKVLISVGWQEICTNFHRCHPETRKNCVESDTALARTTETGRFKSYRCKNGMWDMSSPIVVSGRHMGNIYFGQFIYSDEELDVERFRNQARRYGFDEEEYLAALDRVPRYDRATVGEVMAFYSRLGAMISALSYSNIKLSRTLTEQKRAEKALKEKTQLLENITDNMFDLVSLTDMKGNFTFLGASHKILNYKLDSLIGKNVLEFVHPEDLPAISSTFNDFRSKLDDNQKVEYRYRCADGAYIWLETVGRFIRDANGSPREILFSSREITGRKKAEAEHEKLQSQLIQAQKIESVGRLAGGVAHDFNNMLGVILGHAELALLQADENHDLHCDLKEIQAAAKRSANITKQLLAFARKEIISPRELDLNHTVDNMLNMLRRLIGEDIDLVWQPAAHLWPVKMDPAQIDQILVNLCVNARDAIDGVGKLTIETGKKSFDEEYCSEHHGFIPGDFILLAVSDNGCGMDKETLENLFEPFFTTKEVGKGTGMGLSTVYGIVRQNNGFINVYSEPGQGSTLKIYLPRLVADGDSDLTVPVKKETVGGTETILLVEDEPSILRMTRMMLERKGYTVLTAATPAEALEKAKNHSGAIDLLMTDVVMPEMNGRDLSGQINDLYPDIRLLFMSGYTANVIAHQGVLDDGVAFIQKPFSMADMTVKIREVLEKR